MDGHLPLPTLLSRVLIAFTIEFDNEFERQMPHRTTNHGSSPSSLRAPWLVSMVMWSKFMQFIPDDGISVAELRRMLGDTDKSMQVWLTRMGKWWGYIVVEPDMTAARSRKIDPATVVHPTAAGRQAMEVWRPLTAAIESRWQKRFGRNEIGLLIESLRVVTVRIGVELPDSLPILGYGLFSKGPDRVRDVQARDRNDVSELRLPALLSKVLLAFAIEFERDSEVSLAICANVLRLLGKEGVRVRDLPRLSGVSKEAIAMSLSFLQTHGHAVVEPESPGSRVKLLTLTPKGSHARDQYDQLVRAIEERWQARFGEETIRTLRESLETLADDPAKGSPLFNGLEPYPDGWRASVPRPHTLPHYPMILHRGGFPDGS